MDVEKAREQFRNSPEWAFVALLKRIEALEQKLLPKPRGRPKKVKENGNQHIL